MSKYTYPLRLPTSVKKAAAELAATEGVLVNCESSLEGRPSLGIRDVDELQTHESVGKGLSLLSTLTREFNLA